jgi:N utilization substance protein A
MRRDQSIPRELFNIGDRIRCYIYDVRRETKGPQIMLSRAHPGFMAKLFAQEVPEVYDGVIEIRAVARDPGSRAKMAVLSNDGSIDPVGACVGMRGSRVQAVVAELQGEKIDIINWSNDEATFLVNALAPAEVSKVMMDEEEERVEVVVPDEQLSLAIGRRGQNVRLASQLTGWQIDIMTEAQESERRQRSSPRPPSCSRRRWTSTRSSPSCWRPRASPPPRRWPTSSPHEIASIEGFDEDTAEELQARAREFLDKEAAALDAQRRELGVEDGVLDVEGITLPMAVALGQGGVKTLEDLADLATDEIRGGYEQRPEGRVRVPGVLEQFGLSMEDAETLILRARVAAGWIDAADLQQPEEEGEGEYAEGEADAGSEQAQEEPV